MTSNLVILKVKLCPYVGKLEDEYTILCNCGGHFWWPYHEWFLPPLPGS